MADKKPRTKGSTKPLDRDAAGKRRLAPPRTPNALGEDAVRDISAELNALLADTLALYLKTKNFHWHMWGPSFRDYHLLLDEQGDQIYATDGSHRRTRAQARRHHAALHRPRGACSAWPTTTRTS